MIEGFSHFSGNLAGRYGQSFTSYGFLFILFPRIEQSSDFLEIGEGLRPCEQILLYLFGAENEFSQEIIACVSVDIIKIWDVSQGRVSG